MAFDRGERSAKMQLDAELAFASDGPHRREQRLVAHVRRHQRLPAVRVDVAQRERLHVASCAPARAAAGPRGTASPRCRRWSSLPGTRRRSRRRPSRGDVVIHAPRVGTAAAFDEQRADARHQRPDQRPVAISDLATKTPGTTAYTEKMSSHDTWFSTTMQRAGQRVRDVVAVRHARLEWRAAGATSAAARGGVRRAAAAVARVARSTGRGRGAARGGARRVRRAASGGIGVGRAAWTVMSPPILRDAGNSGASAVASTCIFCRIVAGEIPASKVYEDAATIAFMDIGAVNPGHVLVATKAHVENVFGLDDAQAAAVMRTVARVSRALRDAFAPAGRQSVPGQRPRRGADGLPLPRPRAAAPRGRRHATRVAGAESAARGAHRECRAPARGAEDVAPGTSFSADPSMVQ